MAEMTFVELELPQKEAMLLYRECRAEKATFFRDGPIRRAGICSSHCQPAIVLSTGDDLYVRFCVDARGTNVEEIEDMSA